jgi:hypothetical protein
MSRPTQTDSNYTNTRKSVIDFVNAPMPMNAALYPADDMFMQANYVPVQAPLYTMAGYPQTPGQPTAFMQAPMQAPYQIPVTTTPQGYTAAYATPYYTYPAPALPEPAQTSLRTVAPQPSTTEETLQQKVDAKIDAIMAAHKTDMLSQQITRLTDKVQKLSHNIAAERNDTASSTMGSEEGEMSRRLRKLAAESGRRPIPESKTTPLF